MDKSPGVSVKSFIEENPELIKKITDGWVMSTFSTGFHSIGFPIREKIERAIEYHKKQGEDVEAVVLKEELFDDWLEAFKDDFEQTSLVSYHKWQAFSLSIDVPVFYFYFVPNQSEDFYTFQSPKLTEDYLHKMVGRLDAEEQLKRRRFLSVDEADRLGFSYEVTIKGLLPHKTKKYQLQPAKWLDKYEYWHYVEV